MKLQYVAFVENRCTPELGEYRTYGIRLQNENGDLLDEIADISTNAVAVWTLAERCTNGQLSPLHFHDVIEDYLS